MIVNKESKKKILGAAKKLVIYIIYALVAYFIYDKISGTKDLLGDISKISLPFVLTGILIYSILIYVNTLIWHFMMKSTGENVTLESQIGVYLRSYMLRYIPGNVVGVVSRGELNRKYGVSRVKSLWAWFLENVIFLTIGMSIGSYFLIKNLTTIFDLSTVITSRNDVVMVSGIAVVVITLIASYLLLNKGDVLVELFNKYVVKKILKNNREKEIHVKFSLLSQLVVVLGYAATWALYSLAFLAIVYSINPGAISYPLALISVNALSWAIGYLVIITPSGTGVREAVFISLLPLIDSITGHQGVIIALTMRLVTIIGELLAFGSFEAYLFIKNHYGRKK